MAVRVRQNPIQWPKVAEALSLGKMMQICDELELNHVIYEGDCLFVVKVVTSDETNWSDMGSVVLEI